MNQQIEIHEFSTGINLEIKADGTWFSKGFLGTFMNQTLESIPEAIIASIRNREFEITEGASNKEPALIGREVCTPSGEDKWSVVAVVTRGKDESRGFSAYRYFCCQGHRNISKIIRFLLQNRSDNIPVFNPLDEKTIGNPHLYQIPQETYLPLENFQDLLEQKPPVVIPTGRTCTPLVVNEIATTLGEKHNQLVAWAYNVGGVQYPRSFDLIKPNSEKAEQIIRKTLAEKPNNPQRITGEEDIKTAIKTLANRDKIKLEHLQTLNEALENSAIPEQFWQTIFDSQGLKEANNQGIYTPPMVKLFTLQAIILPNTLPTFLEWLEKGKDKKDKQDNIYRISHNFQKEIQSNISQGLSSKSQLFQQIKKGVIDIIPYLLSNQQLLESFVRLLQSKEGLWSDVYHHKIIKYIEHDLRLIRKKIQDKSSPKNNNNNISNINDNTVILMKPHSENPNQEQNQNNQFKILSLPSWKKVYTDLYPIIQSSYIPHNKQYLVFAELFSALENYKFAALFYQIAQGKVPKKVFGKICKYEFCRGFDTHLYGCTIEREIDQLEGFSIQLVEIIEWIIRTFIKVADMKIPLWLVVILILLFSAGSIFGAKILFFDPSLKLKSKDVEQCINDLFVNNETKPKSASKINKQKTISNSEEEIKQCFDKFTGEGK